MLNGCTVGTTSQLLSMLRDARGPRSQSGTRCQSNARRSVLSSPRVPNHVSRLLSTEVPCGSAGWRLRRFVFVNQYNKVNQEIAGTRVYISHLPALTSILFSSRIKHTAWILISLHNMWHAQNNASHSTTHQITYKTLYIPSKVPCVTFNCIIMLTGQV